MKSQLQQDDVAADILQLTAENVYETSNTLDEAPKKKRVSKRSSSSLSKRNRKAPKKNKKNNRKKKNQSIASSRSKTKMQDAYTENANAAPTVAQGQNGNIQAAATASSSSSSMPNARKQRGRRMGNPPLLLSQQNYRQPGAYAVRGSRRQDNDDDDSSSWNEDLENPEPFAQDSQSCSQLDSQQPQNGNGNNQNNHSHLEHRRQPPMSTVTAIPMAEDTEVSQYGTYRNIIIVALIIAVVIVVLSFVFIFVLLQGGGNNDDPVEVSSPTTAPNKDTAAPNPDRGSSPTQYPSESRNGNGPYMAWKEINLNDFPFLTLYAFQYGFDLTACQENDFPPGIEFTCPGGAIVMATAPTHYNSQGKDVTNINPIACEAVFINEIGCSYKSEHLREENTALSTVFILGCAAESEGQGQAILDVRAEQGSLSSCTPMPQFFLHSMSYGQICNVNVPSELSLSSREYTCAGEGKSYDLDSLHACGTHFSCPSSTCSIGSVQVVTQPDTACIISQDTRGTFDGVWSSLGFIEQVLDNLFINREFTQDALMLLPPSP